MTGEAWQDYLAPGERLLWQGAPVPGIFDLPKRLLLAAFGTPFLVGGVACFGFGLFFMGKADGIASLGLGIFLAIFATPFLAVGLYLVVLQWIEAMQAHRRVRYALTDRAAYIARRYWRRSLEVLPIRPQTAVELVEGKGASTVWLHTRREDDGDGGTTTEKKGFENIAEGRDVFALIRGLQTRESR
ncbi:hypothetical protein [Rhodobacter calidifons]|uniref:PH (Pleckstrin Homology) domain-containing protein n=1 Tax=Rhodobacter calidifons TaxID=2715277 RepID=A0ABX0G250_9RHOB|nr:hypothetical protein [Rhodobacter calidifons]NHB75311.1 hypothetical protein [Rhodobacter calidifons]